MAEQEVTENREHEQIKTRWKPCRHISLKVKG